MKSSLMSYEKFIALIFLVAVFPVPSAQSFAATELVFLVDGSDSIDATDWQTQKDALTAALQDEVAFPRDGSVSVGVVQWSFVNSNPQTSIELELTPLGSESSVDSAIAVIQAMSQIDDSTNPEDSIRTGTNLLVAGNTDPVSNDWILCMTAVDTSYTDSILNSAAAYAKENGVDKFSVIGIEDPDIATASELHSHYSPHVFDNLHNFANDTVTIARNSIDYANLIVGTCLGSPVNLRALEVNQAVQDWHNSIPHIAGKKTTVRAFIQTPDGGDDQRVVGRLYGRKLELVGGRISFINLPGSPLLAINPGSSIVATEDIESRRGNLEDSLNFELPPAWRSGIVELVFDAAGAPVNCEEPSQRPPEVPGGYGENDCIVYLNFQDEVSPEIVFVGVKYTKLVGYTPTLRPIISTFEPSNSELLEQMFRVRSIFPIAGIDYRLDTMGNYEDEPSLTRVNSDLALKRFLDAFSCLFSCSDPDTLNNSYYYGVLAGFGGGLAEGIPGRVSSGFLDDTDSISSTGYARNRGAHELAHTLGRHHAVDNERQDLDGNKLGWCMEVASASAPGHTPFESLNGSFFLKPVLGTLSLGENNEVWGMDNRFLFNDPTGLAVVAPRETFELMSYCEGGPQGRWVSKFTYEGLMGSFLPTSTGSSTGNGREFVIVGGIVDFDTNTATLNPVLDMIGNPPTPAGGDYQVQLLDEFGNELAAMDFEPSEMDADAEAPETPTGPPIGHFIVALPKPDTPIAQVVIQNNGATIASASASDNVPTVEILSPEEGDTFNDENVEIKWDGNDSDGDALHYTVLYSADAGNTWDALVINTMDTSLEVPRANLVASIDARVQVKVSDGFNSGSTISNPFVVSNNAPLSEIVSPHDGDSFSSLQNISLVAEAYDTENKRLAGTSLSWSSDQNGVLGIGSELTVNAADLKEGSHVVTVTATDNDGALSMDSVVIEVFRVASPMLPAVIEVDIQVKPGTDMASKRININEDGVTPVAILTTDDFNAMTVDYSTVCFGNANDPENNGSCTEVHGKGDFEDVDGDYDIDMVLHFDTRELGIEAGDRVACLIGENFDGNRFSGCDEIKVND